MDIPGDQSTTATISVGGAATDQLEAVGDRDWFAITLTASQAVTITLNGITLQDPYLYIRDSTGALLFENDDISSGVNLDSRLAFNPSYSGKYYIDVGAFDDLGAGHYQVSVDPYTFPPVATADQIADQLLSGYWEGDSHHWNVTQGGTLTVNITDLNFSEKALARAALAAWSDIIGIHFQEVSGTAQITFSNDEGPDGLYAATMPEWSGGIMTAATVQISTSWINAFGSTLNSYGFETYVHEVGHALGLGHAGNYNIDARYPYDALFANDALPMSIMSYFDATDVFYFHDQNFTDAHVMTPMIADILAMQALYGLSTSTSPGNTTYGFNSDAVNPVYHADLYPNVAYTVFDTGGVDTFDFSSFSGAQLIDLRPEQFSNVLGNGGTISIARGVIVENAIGGSGADIITGNSSDNLLVGGDGDDTLIGGAGLDRLAGGNGSDVFKGTAAGLNGDTITDFTRGDRIVISDAANSQTLGWSNGQLVYGTSAIALSNLSNASIVAVAVPEGGIHIGFGGPAIIVSGGSSASAAPTAESFEATKPPNPAQAAGEIMPLPTAGVPFELSGNSLGFCGCAVNDAAFPALVSSTWVVHDPFV